MADLKKRLSINVDGEFFVDSTCINCDTCRQLAPTVFEDSGEYSFVTSQPQGENETRQATQALLACPTGSIGTVHQNTAKAVIQDFPMRIEDNVYYCGFNSPQSFGGNSYFVQHPQGNWLIDSPKYLPHLVKSFEAMGGITWIFLTHEDDVADADKYAKAFNAKRIIHKAELSAQPDAEVVIEGEQPVEIAPEFLVIPTPGHTKGHCVLLYREQFLFTGDHLWWRRSTNTLGASERVAWYSWKKQLQSLEKLLAYRFEWVLPGHGQRQKRPPEVMHQALEQLVARLSR